jgi:hypothetical protein
MLCAASTHAADPDADELMRRNYDVGKIQWLTSSASMRLVNDKGQERERKTTGVSSLQKNGVDSNLVVRFLEPADVRGTAFLQIQHADRDDDMWIYLPALKKTRRLVASNKRDSFVGTDFSYADILPLRPGQFRHRLVRSETVDGQDCYVVDSEPKEETVKHDLGYARRTTWLRKDNYLETKVVYLDASGRALKTQTATQHEAVGKDGKHWLARRRDMLNHDTGHRTVLVLDRIDTTTPVPDSAFRVQAIERD